MKTSTLLVTIVDITDEEVIYTSRTDVAKREFTHIIPYGSKFPFRRLKIGSTYALVCVSIQKYWYWWVCYDLTSTVCVKDVVLQVEI